MRMLIFFAFALVVGVTAFQEVQTGYHESVGIPEAKRMKALEDQALLEQENRIVGGVSAPVNAHPYLAGLVVYLTTGGTSACGATLLSANRLVTAAHCWNDGINMAYMFTVVLGSQFLFSGGTRINTNTVVLHPQFVPPLTNDVAMIYLPSSVWFSTAIQPLALPSGSDMFDTFAGQWAIAPGFGKTNDAQLGVSSNTFVSHVSLRVITVNECLASFGSQWVHASTICTSGVGGVGICGGDSGGPLVFIRNRVPTLIGISSFVARDGCQLQYPSAFSRVTSYMNFIQQHMW